MFAPDQSTHVHSYSVTAAAEASVMPRILDLFAKRGLMPFYLHAAIGEDERLNVDLRVCGLESESAQHVARCLRRLVAVERVLMAGETNNAAAYAEAAQ